MKYCQRILRQLLLASLFKHEVQAVHSFHPTYESLNYQLLHSSETLPTHFSNSSVAPKIQPLCSTTVLTLHPDTIFPILIPVTKWEWRCCLHKISQYNSTFILCISPQNSAYTFCIHRHFLLYFLYTKKTQFLQQNLRQNTRFLRLTLQPDFLVAQTPAVENFCMYFTVHQAPTNYQFLPYSLGAGQYSQHSDQATGWMTAKSWIDTRHG